MFNLHTNFFFVSRDVHFHEDIFPFKFPLKSSFVFSPQPIISNSNYLIIDSSLPHGHLTYTNTDFPTKLRSPIPPSPAFPNDLSSVLPTATDFNTSISILVHSATPIIPKKSSRVSKPLGWLKNFVCAYQSSPSSLSLIAYDHLPLHTQTFISAIFTDSEPQSYSNAVKIHFGLKLWKRSFKL